MTRRALPLLGLLAVLASGCGTSLAGKGQRLFEGELALTARIAGHGDALPVRASRCINCHAVEAQGGPQRAASAGLANTKIVLSAPWLTGLQARRGGPPSRFDDGSLCRLLRTGIDPAGVLIPQIMPRYDVDEAECKALWAYLATGRAG